TWHGTISATGPDTGPGIAAAGRCLPGHPDTHTAASARPERHGCGDAARRSSRPGKGTIMDENLKRDMDRTIERGKAETEEMRAEVLAQSDDARADLDNRAAQAEGEVREHFDEVRGE